MIGGSGITGRPSAARRRDYGGPADLRAMQDLVQRTWSLDRSWHIGDLAWQRFMHTGREPEWRTALWKRGGEVVAWGWTRLPGTLSLSVRPGLDELADAVLDWFHGLATPPVREVRVLETEADLVAALGARGYRRGQPDPRRLLRTVRDLDDLPAPTVPDGFVVRPVRGPDDLGARVAVHRAAFAPSRVTEESYAAVMAAWPYRSALDRVVETPDGRFAAFCLAWLDTVNRVGLLEPVGAHPEFRRLGLARAACLGALHALRAAGATRAVVETYAGSGAEQLYRSLGFRAHTRTATFALTVS
jgi:ribosomal protein S18 acetylase RimI-like enzyme